MVEKDDRPVADLPGPRDGLMTGLARRGMSVRTARTLIEVTVVAGGIALGGTAGIGTIAFALAIESTRRSVRDSPSRSPSRTCL
jgi:uncharacterized membrane protein YczE